MILVVCALLAELRFVRPRAGIEIVAGGVGPVEAALATARTLALASKPFDAVINAGIAGAFRGRARVGDAVVVATEWLADIGLEGGGDIALPGGEQLVDCERASDGLVAAVRSL
ncbi:MAG: futalosine hydrolase, partial [Candidatus Eremiobacteraeota bacterium]|nr:futalosine hydrolase [Candidatus Eremiobacteraeota bacterium]